MKALLHPSASPTPWLLRTSLGFVGALGTAPSAAAGAAAGVGVRLSLQLGFEARADLPASKSLGPRGSASSSLLRASFVPCAVLRRAVSPFACGIASVGRFEASAEDVLAPTTVSAAYFAMGARAGLEIPMNGWLSAYGQLDAGATLTRHRLDLGATNVFTLPAIWGSAGVGAAAFF